MPQAITNVLSSKPPPVNSAPSWKRWSWATFSGLRVAQKKKLSSAMSAIDISSECLLRKSKAGDQNQPPAADAKATKTRHSSPMNFPKAGPILPTTGMTDLGVPVPRANMPSSFGLTFCVGGSTEKIKVSAHWGQYLRDGKKTRLTRRRAGQADLETASAGRRCRNSIEEWSDRPTVPRR